MQVRVLLATAAFAASLATGSSAVGAQFYIDMRGTMTGGYYNDTDLGKSINLSGKKMEAVFLLDTATYYPCYIGNCSASDDIGSSIYPHVSGSILVDGVFVGSFGKYSGMIFDSNGSLTLEADDYEIGSDFSALWAYGGSLGPGFDWRTIETDGADFTSGEFNLISVIQGGGPYGDDVANPYAEGTFTIDFTAISASYPTSRPDWGVPEPSTWAMLVLGFGGLGALSRRRMRSAKHEATPAHG